MSTNFWPEILNDDIVPSGNWSDFNKDYKTWLNLERLSNQFGKWQLFYSPDDLIPPPNPDDYSNLNQ